VIPGTDDRLAFLNNMSDPFKFAVRFSQLNPSENLPERAHKLEELGYYAIHISDHVVGPGEVVESTGHPPAYWAAVPVMMALVDATKRICIGARVLCVDYHHPVVLAKEMATIDLLSDGRLEIGLGAGWLGGEYDAIGTPFEAAHVRIDKLGETVALMKALFEEGAVSFHGRYFHVEGFEGAPKPKQSPWPPFAIGGGSPKVLRLAAQQADIVSLNYDNRSGRLGADGIQRSTAEATRRKIEWVRAAAGERFDEIQLETSANFVDVTDHPMDTAQRLGDQFGLTTADMMAHPHVLMGSIDGICEELARRREIYGIAYVTIGEDAATAFAPVVERLTGT
jgi:probable F420-dependent oxidoreductase